ncbi:SOS response-associated peptidase family protein [Massilia sp. MB5]|uniref:SOS response-associated peptidase family protein n=1 Tax=Massilia sp. MB5 TaxID=2919578 RepID=UPI001F1155E9|nr:SOS response-associated peptidase family protein [Massilia sp. MB5]UMR29219.1 SOS response-associated peptidase family protein [Massilia sp. MB5]
MSCTESIHNASPGMMRPVLHVEGSALVLDDVYWGYQAPWAMGKVPVAINASMDKLAGRYWAHRSKAVAASCLRTAGTNAVGRRGKKQPWHIHRADGQLLYIVALACLAPQSKDAPPALGGFALLTADAEGGMVDIHDRSPVMLTAADAATWMNPELSGEQAAKLARNMALGPAQFSWHMVDRAISNSRNQGEVLARAITTPYDS